MVNMQMKVEDKPKETMDSSEMEQPKYPYGLQITLDDDAIETLGMTNMSIVGSTMMLNAKVKVTSCHVNEVLKDNDSTPERRIELQRSEERRVGKECRL